MKPPPKIRKTVDRPPLTVRRILWGNPTAKKIWLGVGAIALLSYCTYANIVMRRWNECMTNPINFYSMNREQRAEHCKQYLPK